MQKMPDSTTAIEPELGPVIGQVQTDTFCENCGYNLHTQAVLRDTRLGILVCRCPECGRFAPAGRISSASRVWLNRLGIALLLAWMVFLLGSFGLGTLFLGMAAYGHASEGTRWEQIPQGVPNAPGQTYMTMRYVVDDRSSIPPEEAAQRRQQKIVLGCVAAVLGTIVGGMFSAFLWHCRGWRRLFAFVPPLVACGFAATIWSTDSMTVMIRDWGQRRIGEYFLWECLWVAIGLLVGRPIARGALHILLPPRLRQHLAFLWTTDGKQLAL